MKSIEHLFEFSREITGATNIGQIYRKIIDYAKETLSLDFSTISLISEDKARLVVRDTIGFPESIIGTSCLADGQEPAMLTLKSGKPETFSDLRNGSSAYIPGIVPEHGIRSAICVPIIAGDEFIGALIGHTLANRTFTGDEIGFYMNIGSLAAVAVRNCMSMANLREGRDEWEDTFNAVPELVAIIDTDYNILRMNKAMAETLGVKMDEAVGSKCYSVVHNIDAPPDFCPHARMLADSCEHQSVYFEQRLDQHYLVSVTPVFDKAGNVLKSVHIARNISEIQQARKQIENEREFLQTVIDGISDGIMVIDMNFRVHLMNKTARMNGNIVLHEDGLPRCHEISHGQEVPCDGSMHPCPLQAARQRRKPVTLIHMHKGCNNRETTVEIHASPIFNELGEVIQIVEIYSDITERLRLEQFERDLNERLANQQKEESISTLAGGIAHEFNNCLMSVQGNAELLQRRIFSPEKTKRMLGSIYTCSERMANLVRQLIAYAGKGMYQRTLTGLNDTVHAALTMIHKGKAAAIPVSMDLADDIRPVLADNIQLTQIIINILSNAFEAMETSGGRIFIGTANEHVEASQNLHRFQRQCAPGDYVRLTISDTGPGIPDDILDRIFDPFFSTRFLGRGLGLAAVAGIVKSHSGCLSVESSEGKGTTFHVFLPQAVIEPKYRKELPAGKEPRQHETILIVDDDPAVLSVLRDMLQIAGYNLLAASSGIEAIALFRKEPDAVRLAIIDIQMERMNGRELFIALRSIRPDLKIVIASGYDDNTAKLEMGECIPDYFLRKPFGFEQMRSCMRKVLG
ncbi:MAG: PAS domain-containing protein [Nitrospirae bacterium]|nr:PAS domain-containing protein [Nitrospirota bacterium]